MANEILLDANAILRLLLNDVEEQNAIVKEVIESKRCWAITSVIQECIYILEHYYSIPRDAIKDKFIDLEKAIHIENEDLYERSLEHYVQTPKLDFVDCLLCAYKELTDITVLTFDEKLKKKLENI